MCSLHGVLILQVAKNHNQHREMKPSKRNTFYRADEKAYYQEIPCLSLAASDFMKGSNMQKGQQMQYNQYFLASNYW